MFTFIFNYVTGLFSKGDSKNNIIWIIIILMVILPIIYFIYDGISTSVKSIFNIKSKTEVIAEQKGTIDTLENINTELNKQITLEEDIHKIDVAVISDTHKDIVKVDKITKEIKDDVAVIDPVKYTELKKEVNSIKTHPPDEVISEEKIAKTYMINSHEYVAVDKEEYEVVGLNNYNSIMAMYDTIKGDFYVKD